MTPKAKAKELVDKYNFLKQIFIPSIHEQKQCALIAVDEILNLNLGFSNCDENNWETEKFYKEVKQEIEKI